MVTKALSNTYQNISKKHFDLLLGLGGSVALAAILLLFPSWVTLALIFLSIFGVTAIYLGYDYFPLVLFAILAFSVELRITEETRITLPTEALIPLMVILFGLEILFKGKIAYRPSMMNWAVFLFYLTIISSYIVSQEPISTIKALIRDTGYIFAGYYLIPRYVTSERRLKHILIVCLVIHTLLVFYGFGTQIVNGLRIYDEIAAPFFIEHCIYAAFVTLSFSFLFAFFLDREDDHIRMILGIVSLIFAVAVGLTFVRAAWFSIVILLFYYLFQFSNKRSSIDLIIIMMVGFMIGLALLFTSDIGRLITQRIETIADFQYVANYDRIDRWVAAWLIWLDYPYFGVGWGAYPDMYFDYNIYDSFSSDMRMGAHNLYLEIMSELGVVGLLVFLFLIYTFFKKAIILQSHSKSRMIRVFLIGMQGAMITYLFHAFLNNLGPSDKISIYFWFMLGMIPTIQGIVASEDKEVEGLKDAG